MAAKFIPPIIGAKVPSWMTFRERVFWYSIWIQANPLSHVHFVDHDEKHMFISERHVNL